MERRQLAVNPEYGIFPPGSKPQPNDCQRITGWRRGLYTLIIQYRLEGLGKSALRHPIGGVGERALLLYHGDEVLIFLLHPR